jgi:hypothetical protein
VLDYLLFIYILDRAPTYIKDMEEKNVVLGSFVIFTCVAESDKDVTWIRRSENEILSVNDPEWVQNHEVKVFSKISQNFPLLNSPILQSKGIQPDDSRMLAIEEVSAGDSGWYHCLTKEPLTKEVSSESAAKMTVLGGN